jgi:hypothetical protein
MPTRNDMRKRVIQDDYFKDATIYQLKPEGKVVIKLQAHNGVERLDNDDDAPHGLPLVHFRWTTLLGY